MERHGPPIFIRKFLQSMFARNPGEVVENLETLAGAASADFPRWFHAPEPYAWNIWTNKESLALWKHLDGMPGFCNMKSIICAGLFTLTGCRLARLRQSTTGIVSGKANPSAASIER